MPIQEMLNRNSYPGRGIVLGQSQNGNHAFIAYFIMGRSANSRNRVFEQHGSDVMIKPADPSKVEDPSLIVYSPVRRLGEWLIVSNGDQTDTIYEHLQRGESFEEALRTRSFEPDAPNFTPRISGVVHLGFDGFSYKLSELKSEGEGKSVRRFFWEYPQPQKGKGHFIHTYAQPKDPLPSFVGEPLEVDVDGSLAEFGQSIWGSLNEENKISLLVRSTTLDGEEETILYNKYSPL